MEVHRTEHRFASVVAPFSHALEIGTDSRTWPDPLPSVNEYCEQTFGPDDILRRYRFTGLATLTQPGVNPIAGDPASALRLISESLGLVERLGADPIHVSDLRMMDSTLVVEILARSADSIGVRREIAGVMGALSGLGVPDLFPVLEAQFFGVRAFDARGQEVMWIVSSIEAAKFIASGQPIEWLAHSVVQENTAEYRRGQADRIIGQIETALRDVVHHHGREIREDYIGLLLPASDLTDVREKAQKEGNDGTDPRSLLDYTYLPQLGKALLKHIEWFADGCVGDSELFQQSMTQLNRVRRKVAHHREISEQDLRICREVVRELLARVGRVHPDLVDDFLTDRWDSRVEEILAVAKQRVQASVVPDRGVVPEPKRRGAAVAALDTHLRGIEAAIAEIGKLVVPPQRSEVHGTLVDALTRWRDALRELVVVARRPNLTALEAEVAGAAYGEALDEVRELYQHIQGLRQGVPLS